MGIFKTNKPRPQSAGGDEQRNTQQWQVKPRPSKSDLQIVLDVQRKYDETVADLRVINNALLGVLDNGVLPMIVQFRNAKELSETDLCFSLIVDILNKYDLVKKTKSEG